MLASLAFGGLSINAQNTTMIVQTTNGNTVRTDVNTVDKITFEDAEYNLNKDQDRILEYNELTWPEDRLLPLLLPPANTVRGYDPHAKNLASQERVMFATLQGIVNRNRPRILLYNHNEEPRATWPNAHNLHMAAVSVAPYAFVKRYVDEIKGIVLYSTAKSEHYGNLAVTVA